MQNRNGCLAALTAVLAFGLCQPQRGVAQVSPQGNQSPGMFGNAAPGMFGNRTLGQPLVPGRSKFGGGIQTSPSGSFLYIGRPDGWNHLRHALAADRPGHARASPRRQPRRAAGLAGPACHSIACAGVQSCSAPERCGSRPPVVSRSQ